MYAARAQPGRPRGFSNTRAGVNADEPTDTAVFRYEHYLRWTDTAEHLNFETLAMVVDGLVPVLEALGDAETPRF